MISVPALMLSSGFPSAFTLSFAAIAGFAALAGLSSVEASCCLWRRPYQAPILRSSRSLLWRRTVRFPICGFGFGTGLGVGHVTEL
jgi:hypothetical protein